VPLGVWTGSVFSKAWRGASTPTFPLRNGRSSRRWRPWPDENVGRQLASTSRARFRSDDTLRVNCSPKSDLKYGCEGVWPAKLKRLKQNRFRSRSCRRARSDRGNRENSSLRCADENVQAGFSSVSTIGLTGIHCIHNFGRLEFSCGCWSGRFE